MNKEKILMIIPNLGMGGAQRSFAKLVNWLSEKYDVSVAVFDNAHEDHYAMITDKVYFLSSPAAGAGIINKVKAFLKRLKNLRQIKNTIQPHASISFLEGADYLNMLSGPSGKRIISIRGSKRYDPHISGFFGWLRKKVFIPLLYKKADVIVAASAGLQHEFKKDYPQLASKFSIIPNGYEKNYTGHQKKDSSYFIFTWAGRFGDEKGLAELLIVFSNCFKENNRCRLLLLGDGAYKETLQQWLTGRDISYVDTLVYDSGLFNQSAVIFCSPGTRYEEYLAQGDIFLLTSPSEGFPNVIMEAIQQGLPVVSTDCNWGPREILAPSLSYGHKIDYPFYAEYGVLLPVLKNEGDIKLWSATLLSLVGRTEVISAYKSKASAVLHTYDAARVKKMWFDLLNAY